MATIQIPRINWPTALADAIQTAQRGDTIVVHGEYMKKLAKSAMRRMDREDLHVIIDLPEKEV